jgi:predicted DNA-binding protein (MmcQ/YjbR family)
MNIEQVRSYCLSKKGVTEDFPFDDTVLVFRIAGKIFVLCALDSFPPSINLKCDPIKALELRELHPYVVPGYHMNKKHWNTVLIEAVQHDTELYEWIDESYNLVIKGLPINIQKQLKL